MMPVTRSFITGKTRNYYIGFKLADHPNHITQYLFFVPDAHGLISTFAITKIVCSCKKLFSTIYAACR